MDLLNNILDNTLFQSIIGCIVGGLVVYYFQRRNDAHNKTKEKEKKIIVGSKSLHILSQDFLYEYEPGKVTIQKLIHEFGQPHRRSAYGENILYMFEFQNAKVEITESEEFNDILSITVFSKLDTEHPINCRLSFEEEDEILGNAKISDIIIKDSFLFESNLTQLGSETIIGCHNDYRQTKYLKYFYLIGGSFDKIEDTKGEIISQVCVSQSDSYSFFSSYDTFYN